MYDTILVPTDGSDVAAAAADAAVALAREFDAAIHAVHVLELGELPAGVDDEYADEFAHRGEQATADIADKAAAAGVEITTAVIEPTGKIHDAIVGAAEDADADCIVMGTYGRTGLDRFVIGSVAEQTLRDAPVPVMTVHEDATVELPFEDVLVPTDGSDCAESAADHAIALAAATGASLHVVNVVDLGVVWGDIDTGTVLDALEASGKRALDRVVDRAEAADVSTVEASVLSGTPYHAIDDYAEENGADCIVMGTHGRTGLDRYLLGSVTERVIRLSDVPVLATKDFDAAE